MCQSRTTSMILDAEVLLSFCCHHQMLACDHCLLTTDSREHEKSGFILILYVQSLTQKTTMHFEITVYMLCDNGFRFMSECGSLSSLSVALNVLMWIHTVLWLARSVDKSSLENMIVFTYHNNCPEVCMQGLVFAQYCIKQLCYSL